MTSASSTIPLFLDEIRRAHRSKNTIKTYTQALRLFESVIGSDADLSEGNFITFLQTIDGLEGPLSNSSHVTYRVAVSRLYEYHAPGVPVKLLIERYGQRRVKRRVNFDEDAVEKLLAYCMSLRGELPEKPKDRDKRRRLEALRDRAFVLALADTGLRISEACSLTRGDIDFSKARAEIIGKGDKPGTIRFSARSLSAIRLYIKARADLDGKTGRSLSSLPVFARHDRGSGNNVKPVHSGGMWRAIADRMIEAGLEPGSVTPHKFRHYFVTRALRSKSGSLHKAAELARHEDINITRRYSHLAPAEIDEAYHEIFDKETG